MGLRLLFFVLLSVIVSTVAIADGYRFIVENNHVEAAPSRAASLAISLDTGALATSSSGFELEARYLTMGVSEGVSLNSTKSTGLLVILK